MAERLDPPSAPDPAEVAGRRFSTGFRGFDQDEVRAYLVAVAEAIAADRQRGAWLEQRLAEAERRAEPLELDEHQLTRRLGQQTARVLDAAHEAANEIRSRAEESVARLVRESTEEASALRAAAQEETTQQRTEAASHAEALRTEAEAVLGRAQHEAAAQAEVVLAGAREEGRRLVAEARTVRERVLRDLAGRRKTARQHLEQLRVARGRMLETFDEVRRLADDATGTLDAALPQARAAAEAAARRATAIPDPTLEDLEAELALELSGSTTPLDGVDVVAEADQPARDDEPVGAAEEVEAAAATDVDPTSELELETDEVRLDEPVAVVADEDDVEVEDAHDDAHDVAQPDPEDDTETVIDLVEAEAEAEAAGEAEALPPSDDASPGEVDALFAKIRAAHEDAVVEAEEVLADQEIATSAGGSAGDALPIEPVAVDSEELVRLLERRDAATDEIERRLARRLRRVLADEQSAVLDALRRSRGAATFEEVVVVAHEHAGRTVDAAVLDLHSAVEAGARFEDAAPSPETTVRDLADALANDVNGVVQAQVERSFELAGDDVEQLTNRIRGCYREWKTPRLQEAVGPFVLAAFSRGSYDVLPEDASMRWVGDPSVAACPDAEQNAAAGPTEKGTPFPTGHVYPPAHAACRCLLVTLRSTTT